MKLNILIKSLAILYINIFVFRPLKCLETMTLLNIFN